MRIVTVPVSLQQIGIARSECLRLVATMQEDVRTQQPILDWKKKLQVQDDSIERLILHYAIEDALPRIDSLPVHAAVKNLLRKDLTNWLQSPKPSDPPLEAGSYLFGVALKMATFRRFPAGPMDWTISGIPRSWFLKIPPRDLPRTLYFIATKMGGIKPAIYTHVAPPPRKRTLVIEKEVRRAYYRMAKSLEMQPRMIGIMTGSWVNDPAMLKAMPQLAPLNDPYIQHGGSITTAGPAPADSGFLERSPERQKRYDAGELRPKIGLAMWPRAAAIHWASQHPELDG